MLYSINKKGQFEKQLTILITKEMKEVAGEISRGAKIALRNELEEQHKHDVYSTYAPIQQSGKDTAKYNDEHKHQKKQPYHHSGLLIRSIHGVIDGDEVKIELDDAKYEDGTSVRDVYEYLDKGTKGSEHDMYILGGKKSHTPYVGYVRTPPHRFKRMTLDHMENYIHNTLIPDIQNGKYNR